MWYLCLGAAVLSYMALLVFAARAHSLGEKFSVSSVAGFGFPLILADEKYPISFCSTYRFVYILILCVTAAAYYLFPASFPILNYVLLAVMVFWLLFFTTAVYRRALFAYKRIPKDVRSNVSAVVSLSAIPHRYFAFEIALYIVIIIIVKGKV